MDRSAWETLLICFQASARGYLVRREVRLARGDFEDIVKEIDGGVSHLKWRETVIPIPVFTCAGGPFERPRSSFSEHPKPGLDVCAVSQRPSATAPPSEERRDHRALPGRRTEAERDDQQTKGQASLSRDYFSSSCVGLDVEGQIDDRAVGDKDGGMTESTGDSTTVWSSVELDMSCGRSHRDGSDARNGSRQYHLAQEVPYTPEALRLHRNTLTMELIWLQQAIGSRKKYLSLKDNLSVS